MSIIVPLSDWYPDLYRRWQDSDRRYWVPLSDRTGYTVHHTDGGFGQAPRRYAQGVGDWHYSKWSRPGGYNFQIGRDGTVFEMCGWEHVGAHAPGCNYSTIGVSFQGSYNDRLPNDRQLEAFSQLVNEGPVPARQQGHRDCSSTTCPGARLYRALPLDVEEDEVTEQDYEEIAERVARKLGFYDNGRLRSYSTDAKAIRLGVRQNGAELGAETVHEPAGVNPA